MHADHPSRGFFHRCGWGSGLEFDVFSLWNELRNNTTQKEVTTLKHFHDTFNGLAPASRASPSPGSTVILGQPPRMTWTFRTLLLSCPSRHLQPLDPHNLNRHGLLTFQHSSVLLTCRPGDLLLLIAHFCSCPKPTAACPICPRHSPLSEPRTFPLASCHSEQRSGLFSSLGCRAEVDVGSHSLLAARSDRGALRGRGAERGS